MLDSTLTHPARRQESRFGTLMDLYEKNYLLTRLLAPGLRDMRIGEHVSEVNGCLSLYLHIQEKARYTTTYGLSYRFDASSRYPKQPNLVIRSYHDAHVAEVLSGVVCGVEYGNRVPRSLDSSWRLNRFLYKWLHYCIYRNHSFNGLTDSLSASRD